jgi:hypothetical protein
VLFVPEHVGRGVVLRVWLADEMNKLRMLASRSRLDLSLYFQSLRFVFLRSVVIVAPMMEIGFFSKLIRDFHTHTRGLQLFSRLQPHRASGSFPCSNGE